MGATDFEALKRAYLEGESINSLRRKLGWSHDKIRKLLAQQGVRLRRRDEARELAKTKRRRQSVRMADAGSEAVARAYAEGESIEDLKAKLGWSHERIRRILEEQDIELRDRSEANRIARGKGSGIGADWRPSS